ncbi:MAG: type 1 glutamine amidotransferase [Candidatus Promineifilaceae bacterium]|nr:type 1 glutamine amidotransferase [Candidatus Promineifilaceae bacterium]
MKLGILCAIDPIESELDWGSSPVDAYIRFFQSVNAPFEYAGYYVIRNELPVSPDECDCYVITGSRRGAYDSDLWIAALIDFIRKGFARGKRFTGICFGHQVLAKALGGQVVKAKNGWGLGLEEMQIESRKEWMKDGGEAFSLYFAHQDQVTVLPADAQLLGGSSFCPIGMYTIDRRILGIQGHPEFSASMMESIIAQGKMSDDPALASAARRAVKIAHNGQPDNQLLAQWIVNFFLDN